ncbi:hypothetical protein ACG94V_19290 [Acinetobacter sp. ULE_I001]
MLDYQLYQKIIKTTSTVQPASMHGSITTVDQLGQLNITTIRAIF